MFKHFQTLTIYFTGNLASLAIIARLLVVSFAVSLLSPFFIVNGISGRCLHSRCPTDRLAQ